MEPTAPAVLPAFGDYNPVTVTVTDAIGVTFLGVITLALVIALVRSEARYRALLARTTPPR